MSRRRLLLKKQSPSIFEWFPSDGISDFTFEASTGQQPNYELMQNALRLKAPAAWGNTRLFLKDINLSAYNSCTVEIGANITPNSNANLYTGFSNVNFPRCTYTKAYQTFQIAGSSEATQIVGAPNVMVMKLAFDQNRDVIFAKFNDFPIMEVSSPSKSQKQLLVQVEGAEANYYYDITHIKITRGVDID